MMAEVRKLFLHLLLNEQLLPPDLLRLLPDVGQPEVVVDEVVPSSRSPGHAARTSATRRRRELVIVLLLVGLLWKAFGSSTEILGGGV